MHGLTANSVVDQIVTELRERRHTSNGRRAMYLALARAILSDELGDGQLSSEYVRESTAGHATQAA